MAPTISSYQPRQPSYPRVSAKRHDGFLAVVSATSTSRTRSALSLTSRRSHKSWLLASFVQSGGLSGLNARSASRWSGFDSESPGCWREGKGVGAIYWLNWAHAFRFPFISQLQPLMSWWCSLWRYYMDPIYFQKCRSLAKRSENGYSTLTWRKDSKWGR